MMTALFDPLGVGCVGVSNLFDVAGFTTSLVHLYWQVIN
jgi:hypothetical protein